MKLSRGVVGCLVVVALALAGASAVRAGDDSQAVEKPQERLATEIPKEPQREVDSAVAGAKKPGDEEGLKKEGKTPRASAAPKDTLYDDYAGEDEDIAEISDPIKPFNHAMYTFNDKLYFWALKPVAQGYSYVTPEFVRIGFRNFFNNLKSPVDIVNKLLQCDLPGFSSNLFRLVVNSTVGVGGFWDPSSKLMDIPQRSAEFGQTLGLYGLGHGPYLVLPLFGPSSIRGAAGLVGDTGMTPTTYLGIYYLDWWASASIFTFDKVNRTSLLIGEYESMKEAAVDPYEQMMDVYAQYSKAQVDKARKRAFSFSFE